MTLALYEGHFFDGLLCELRHFQEVQFHIVVEPSLGIDVVDTVHGVHGFFGEDGVAKDVDGDLLSLFAAKDEFEEDII